MYTDKRVKPPPFSTPESRCELFFGGTSQLSGLHNFLKGPENPDRSHTSSINQLRTLLAFLTPSSPHPNSKEGMRGLRGGTVKTPRKRHQRDPPCPTHCTTAARQITCCVLVRAPVTHCIDDRILENSKSRAWPIITQPLCPVVQPLFHRSPYFYALQSFVQESTAVPMVEIPINQEYYIHPLHVYVYVCVCSCFDGLLH